jgi:mannose-6-phosphate isomerase
MRRLNSTFELLPIFRERVWGRATLAPFFSDQPRNTPIGEVWFTFTENSTSLGKSLGEILTLHPEILGNACNPEYGTLCPILVKLLFTTERLSVQVHPADEYAREYHDCLGKTEAWYVLDAQPPGEVAVGFREPLAAERLAEVAQTGEIADLLDWRKVQRGDVIFTPAGTVHAIGAGLTICEIQQNSDITYRLYDYGRPRELHLEQGARVSNLGPHEHAATPRALSAARDELVACSYFRIERIRPQTGFEMGASLPHYAIAICVEGAGELNGKRARAGQAWFIPADGEKVQVNSRKSEWILTYSAPEPAEGIRVW